MSSPWLFCFYCDVIKVPSVQTWFVYFSLSVQPLSTNFELTGVQGPSVDGLVPLGADEVELALVAETAPLRVDDHVARAVVVCDNGWKFFFAATFPLA